VDGAGAGLGPYVRDLVATLRAHYRNYEVVLVDVCVGPTSPEIECLLADCDCLRYVRLSRQPAPDLAVTAGLDAVIGDCVVIVEPGAAPPADVPRIVAACQDGCDVVLGTCARRQRHGPLFGLGRRAFYWLCRRLVTDRLPTNATHFMALSRRAVN